MDLAGTLIGDCYVLEVMVMGSAHRKWFAEICNESEQALDILDISHWSQGKEALDVPRQALVEGEPCEPHDGTLGVAHIEQLVFASVVEYIVQHGGKILLGMLIKPISNRIQPLYSKPSNGHGGYFFTVRLHSTPLDHFLLCLSRVLDFMQQNLDHLL